MNQQKNNAPYTDEKPTMPKDQEVKREEIKPTAQPTTMSPGDIKPAEKSVASHSK